MNTNRFYVFHSGWREIPAWKRTAILVLAAGLTVTLAALLSVFILILLPIALLVGLAARLLLSPSRPPAGRQGPVRRDAEGNVVLEGEWTVLEDRKRDTPEDRG